MAGLSGEKRITHWLKRKERKFLIGTRPVIQWAKKITFPGLDSIPLYDVVERFWNSIKGSAVTMRSSSVAFNLVLAVFPAIIFVFTMIPLIPIPNFQKELLLIIESMVPEKAYDAIYKTIEEIITIPHGGLLSFGFLMALFFSTNGFVSLISAFNASVHVTDYRSWWEVRAIAIALVIITSLLVTIGISLIIFTQVFLDFLVREQIMTRDITYYLISIGKWVVIVSVFFFAYSFLFYLAPARKSKWRFISVGGTVATALSIIITLGFSFYIDRFGRYNALYGSIGTLPVIMLMVYFNCLAMIVGFELNAGIVAARRDTKGICKPSSGF
jgi:membrane protein